MRPRAINIPPVSDATDAALVDALSRFDRLVEVGVGRRTAVAAGLADAGCTVLATDVHDRSVPESVRFVRDDVADPDPSVYRGADAVYALNCPPELHRPVLAVARGVDAAMLFTTLGGDPPAVEATPTTLPGTTLFRGR
jgi:uncharacterized UPF0146 family protein